MTWKRFRLLIAAIAFIPFVETGTAQAACTLPNIITNGQTADATPVMGDFNAIVDCMANPTPSASFQLSGPAAGIVTLQNPAAAANYNFNFPATSGNAGDFLTSGGGGNSPNRWTSSGTSGHTLPYLDGNNVWSGLQTFGPVVGSVTTQAGAVYTLATTDCGTTIVFTSNTAVTLTTINSLPAGCSIAVEQAGAGQVSVTAGAGTTQHSAHNYTKTYGIYAILGIFVDTNAGGTAADVLITGDGA